MSSSISTDAFNFLDLDERLSLPEIDGALLMELLDDPGFDGHPEADRLGCVMRSLEAELGSPVVDDGVDPEVVEYCKLEDVVLSDIESHASSGSTSMGCLPEDHLFDQWVDVDMEVVPGSPEGMGGWYEEGVDQFMGGVGEYAAAAAFYQGEYSSSMEHVYMPLWQ